MNLPTPYGNKVLIKRNKLEHGSIIISNQEPINQGIIVAVPLDNKTTLKVGDEITFEYCIPSRISNLKSDDEFDYQLVPFQTILVVLND